MEANLQKSRSIIVNKTHTKFQQKRYKNHLQAINKVKGSHSCYQNAELDYLANLEKYKKAQREIYKKFDPIILENKALIRRLLHVQSQNGWGEEKQNNIRNIICSDKINREAERRKIEWENNILGNKLKEVKKKMMSSKELKKKFREHDRLVLHAQKIR